MVYAAAANSYGAPVTLPRSSTVRTRQQKTETVPRPASWRSWAETAQVVAGAVVVGHLTAALVFNALVWHQEPQACTYATGRFHYPYSFSDGELCWGCNGRIIFVSLPLHLRAHCLLCETTPPPENPLPPRV